MNTWNFHFPEGSCQLYFCVFPPLLPARHKVGPKFVRSRRRSSAGSRRSMEAGSAVASVPPMAMRRQSVRLCITAPRRCRLSRSTSRRPVASAWSRRQTEPAWRQRHGRDQLGRRGSVEAARAAARAGFDCNHRCTARQPDQSHSCRRSVARCATGGRQVRLKLHVLHASTERDLDTAFASWPNCGQVRS